MPLLHGKLLQAQTIVHLLLIRQPPDQISHSNFSEELVTLANEGSQSCFGFVTNPICHPIKDIQIQIVLSFVKQFALMML